MRDQLVGATEGLGTIIIASVLSIDRYAKRFSEGQAKSMIEDAGFLVGSVKYTGPHHYLITAFG